MSAWGWLFLASVAMNVWTYVRFRLKLRAETEYTKTIIQAFGKRATQ